MAATTPISPRPDPIPGLPDLPTTFPRQEIDAWLIRQGLTLEELVAPDNRALMVEARRIVANYLRQQGWSYPAIGRFLHRDHTTILYLVRGRHHLLQRSEGGIT